MIGNESVMKRKLQGSSQSTCRLTVHIKKITCFFYKNNFIRTTRLKLRTIDAGRHIQMKLQISIEKHEASRHCIWRFMRVLLRINFILNSKKIRTVSHVFHDSTEVYIRH